MAYCLDTSLLDPESVDAVLLRLKSKERRLNESIFNLLSLCILLAALTSTIAFVLVGTCDVSTVTTIPLFFLALVIVFYPMGPTSKFVLIGTFCTNIVVVRIFLFRFLYYNHQDCQNEYICRIQLISGGVNSVLTFIISVLAGSSLAVQTLIIAGRRKMNAIAVSHTQKKFVTLNETPYKSVSHNHNDYNKLQVLTPYVQNDKHKYIIQVAASEISENMAL